MKTTYNALAILNVTFPSGKIAVDLSDGRNVSLPLSWFPKLEKANDNDLNNFEISPSGYGIFWPNLDEDISIKAFI